MTQNTDKKIIFGILLVIVAAIIIVTTISVNDVQVFEDALEVHELKNLDGGLTWELIGKTTKIEQEIQIFIYNPDGILISEDKKFANPDGEFSVLITTGGPLWKESGFYKVTAQQGNMLDPLNSRLFEINPDISAKEQEPFS